MAGGEAIALARGRNVVIIGSQNLQNGLLAKLINDAVGCACFVRTPREFDGLPSSSHLLIMLDAESVATETLGRQLEMLSGTACRSIAIINADEDARFDQVLAWPKVKGVFCRDSSHEHLAKGIRSIFAGEYWLPRKILQAYLERTRASRPPRPPEVARLTRKEVETLRLLAGGDSNSHIARKLNVSTHTVKTHIYNLFRKIQVSNRVQAVNWALSNIDSVERVPR